MANTAAEAYALSRGWDVVYTDSIELEFDRSSVTLFQNEPFAVPVSTYVAVTPASLQNKITPKFTSSSDCVLVTEEGLLYPKRAGTATVTVSYGEARATLNVEVLGQTNNLNLPRYTDVIEPEAFYGNRSIQTVVLPQGITRIESKAFANCTNLKAIWLPSSLSFIASNAFSGCTGVVFFMPMDVSDAALDFVEFNEYPYILCE